MTAWNSQFRAVEAPKFCEGSRDPLENSAYSSEGQARARLVAERGDGGLIQPGLSKHRLPESATALFGKTIWNGSQRAGCMIFAVR